MNRFEECFINSDSPHHLFLLSSGGLPPFLWKLYALPLHGLAPISIQYLLLWVCWSGELLQGWLLVSAFFLNLLNNQNFFASWYILYDLFSVILHYKRYKIEEASNSERWIRFWNKCLNPLWKGKKEKITHYTIQRTEKKKKTEKKDR